VSFGDGGGILIADGINFRLLRYSPQGALLASHGRQGTGPGEYELIEWMGRCGTQTIVFDLMLRRFTLLDAQFRYASSFQSIGVPNAITCAEDGTLVYLNPDFAAPESTAGGWRASASLVALGADRATPRTLATVPFVDAIAVGGSPMPAAGGRMTSLAVLPAGEAVVAPGDETDFSVYRLTSGSVVRIHHGLNSQRVTDENRRASAEEFVARSSDAVVRERVASQVLRQRFNGDGPAYRRIVSDADGILWAQVSLSGEPTTRVIAIDRSGRRLADVRLPFAGNLAAASSRQLALVGEDADGAPVVRIFRVNR
jgi:hypothetical protein